MSSLPEYKGHLNDEDTMGWGHIFGVVSVIAVFACIIGLFVWVIVTAPRVVTPRERCESVGGIFFEGGLFAADNCVFPPKK